jgi:hypothetical protein
MLQFAGDETSFDTVDMYDLVQKTKLLSSVDTTEFDKAFKDTVVYYYTNNDEETNGISVYMPYKGKKTTYGRLRISKILDVDLDDIKVGGEKILKNFLAL